jgi:hypothetical protein
MCLTWCFNLSSTHVINLSYLSSKNVSLIFIIFILNEQQYGDIRTLYTACKHRGFVMISYYDIRAAKNAMKALQNRPLRRRKLDIHYSIPKVDFAAFPGCMVVHSPSSLYFIRMAVPLLGFVLSCILLTFFYMHQSCYVTCFLSNYFCQDNPSEKDLNQGTLAVFNLDSSVSNDDLRQIFGVYGEIKEVSLVADFHILLLRNSTTKA